MLTPIKNYPALIHKQKEQKTLIISDLHLGWELNLIQKGIHVPSQTQKIQDELLQLIDITEPNKLTILGDVKHTIARAGLVEWQDIPKFFKAIKTKVDKIEIIRGNHDGNLEPLLEPTIQLHPSSGIASNAVGLFHGHTWPAKQLLECTTLVMGHVHPTISFRDRIGFRITSPVWVKAKCDAKKLADDYLRRRRPKSNTKQISTPQKRQIANPKIKQLLIMPCFNNFLGGRAINKKKAGRSYRGPILRSQSIKMEAAETYLLDGTFLGTIKQLRGMG